MAYVQRNISKKTGEIINYKFTALLGRDKDGKQIRLTKRVKPVGMSDKAEMKYMQRKADDWEAEEKAKYQKLHSEDQKQKWKEKDKITVVQFIDEYWIPKHVKKGAKPLTPDTIAFYMSMSADIKKYLEEHKPGIKLSAFDKTDVIDYLSYLQNDALTKRNTPYGATTIQHHFSTMRNILEFAVYIDFIADNPCKKIRQEDRPQREQKEIDFLDEEEAVRFLAALDSDEEKAYWEKYHGSHLLWKLMVNTLITTGLRRGELVGLQWGDIDFKKSILTISRNITIDTSNKESTDPEKKIHIGTTKGKRTRKAPVSKYVLDLFAAYREEQQLTFKAIIPLTGYVFCNASNPALPLYPTELTRMMRKFIKRHKLPDVSPHDLRHTAGYLAIESGANVKELQALLGHKDPALSLKFYVGTTEKAQRKTADGIDNLLRPKENKQSKAN